MQDVRSLYIHFPLCMHLCNYCDFYKRKLTSENQIKEFEDLFEKEWGVHEEFLSENKRQLETLETLYIGGGTPSLWKARGAKYLKDFFKHKNIKFSEKFEFTIEVDPGTCENSDLDVWMESGVNRFSVGLQSYSNSLLELMDRKHKIKDANKLFKYLKSKSANFSVDLMIGLPNGDPRDLVFEIEKLIGFGASHFSVYILKTRKNYLHAKNMPEDERVRSEYLLVAETLKRLGYLHYEVSNFALPGFESKHNQRYWDYHEVAALGPNASGLLVMNDKACRYQWKSQSAGFQTELIEGESLIIEKLFLGLRSSRGINLFEIFTSSHEHETLINLASEWKELGYLEHFSNEGDVQLSTLGFLMCDSVIDDIFKKISF